LGVWSAGECPVALTPQAAGAVGLERLRAEALTSQDLADDADGLVAVDRFGQVGLGQRRKVLHQLSEGAVAQGRGVTLRPGEHPVDDPVQRDPPSAGDAVLRQESQVRGSSCLRVL